MQVVIEGVLTSYQIFGNNGETIVILPGWKRPVSEWVPVAKSLSGQFRVILLDLPGFSQIVRPKEPFGIFEYANFVSKFLQKLEITKAILIGHSFGGRIGILLASDSDLVEKLVLVDSGGIEKKSIFVKLIRLIIPFAKLLPGSVQNKIKNTVGSADYKDAGEMRDIFVKIVNQDLSGLLGKIKVPTFIVWGERDGVLPILHAKEFKEKIKGSRLRIVWGAGHDPHLQKREQFLSILGDIL